MIVDELSTIHMNSQKRRKSSKKKKKTIIVTIKILDINKLGRLSPTSIYTEPILNIELASFFCWSQDQQRNLSTKVPLSVSHTFAKLSYTPIKCTNLNSFQNYGLIKVYSTFYILNPKMIEYAN